MAKTYVLAIDQGTTGTTVALFDRSGSIISQINHEFTQHFPKPGWVEHNLEDIWQSTTTGIQKILKDQNISGSQIACIGITNQRETVGIWDRKTGHPCHNAIVWQCRRTTDMCERLKKQGHEPLFRKKTGLRLDPYFSGTKLQWLIKNLNANQKQALKNGDLAAGTIDTYLIFKLSQGEHHATDVTNASRTLLMDINTMKWDPELLKILKIPKSLLPEIRCSNDFFGTTCNVPGLPDGIPITGVAGDQQSALFGQAAFKAGDAKCTYGTGSFILMNMGHKPKLSRSQLLTTVAWQLKGQKPVYALEGGAFVCGAAVQWLRDGLQIIQSSAEVEALALEVADSAGVEFVPALTGLGAPHWKPEARGILLGLTRGTDRRHIARATLEAMALQNVDILLAMEKDTGTPLRSLRVDGGASANNLLMQIQADYLGKTIQRPQVLETTSAGAAFLAGLGHGYWESLDQIVASRKVDKEFKKTMSPSGRTARLESWKKAIKKSY